MKNGVPLEDGLSKVAIRLDVAGKSTIGLSSHLRCWQFRTLVYHAISRPEVALNVQQQLPK